MNTPHNKTPQWILDEMVADYLGGATASAAAKKHGKDKFVCTSELKRHGIELRKRMTPQMILDAIVSDYLNGASLEVAANNHGKTSSVCADELKRRGIETRQLESPDVNDKILIMLKQGCPRDEIAKETARSKTQISRIARRHQIPNNSAQYIRKNARRQGINLCQWPDIETIPSSQWSRSKAWKEWRAAVLKRDGLTCVDCGARDSSLHAHHIFKKCLFPHLTFLPENGVALCADCHGKISQQEERHAARYLAKIGSTIAPIVFYEKSPFRSE